MSSIPRNRKTLNRLLWTAQILLALLFAFAGTMKFVMSPEQMQGPVALPLGFIHFIGVCECLGALGLVLPGLTRIQTMLTPLAAAGLTIIMVGATIVTGIGMGVLPALFPLAVGAISASVALGRARLVPLSGTSRQALRAAHS
jgi:uncharacterized membrane protein YphA (DoxX/SURF4 family)